MPTWIQTAAAAACTGWYDQDVPAQLTRCCTQAGELAAPGWMTCDGRPTTIAGWACSSPSKIQMMPKPIRSSIRHDGSGSDPPAPRAKRPRSTRRAVSAPAGPPGLPAAMVAGRHSRTLTQRSASTPKISSAASP